MKLTVFAIIMVVSIFLDIITGLLKALYTKSFKSSVMRQGLFHKLGEILACALLYGVQIAAPILGIDTNLPMFQVGVGYCVLMEIGSIIENLRAFTPGINNIIGRKNT